MPALDLATRTTSGAAARILAMTGMSSSGPLPQLPPIASAPQAARCRDRVLGGDAHHRVAARVEGHRRDEGDARGGLADALDGGLDLVEVGHRLDPDDVDATGDQRRGLLAEDVDRLVVVERAERRHDLAARADVAGHERRAAGGVAPRPGAGWPPSG